MSSIGDLNYIDDQWLAGLDSSMFTLINPDVICPRDIVGFDSGNENAPRISTVIPNIYPSADNYTTVRQEKTILNQPFKNQSPRLDSELINQPFINHSQLISTRNSSIIEKNSLAKTNLDCKYHLEHQLQIRKALSQQRREQLKARLDRQPLELPRVMRKASGKKLTGRERQIELEREEMELRKHQDNLKAQIRTLEEKCDKLRHILIDIVGTSPQYNEEMIKFLEASELLADNIDPRQNMMLIPELNNH